MLEIEIQHYAIYDKNSVECQAQNALDCIKLGAIAKLHRF